MKQAFSDYPILSCREVATLEKAILSDEAAEWRAMELAGIGIATGLCRDYRELAALPDAFNLLVLVGKGNNGGDAMLACGQIMDKFPDSRATLLFAVEPGKMGLLAERALQRIQASAICHVITADDCEVTIHKLLEREAGDAGFDICIDGLLGMSFNPPLRNPMDTLIKAVNSFDRIKLRAAVDLPSGKGDTSDTLFFRADFTYATGIPKKPLFDEIVECGRIRVVDLGFHKKGEWFEHLNISERVLAESVLQPLQTLLPPGSNKHTRGHIFIIGGSASMPGALLMSVQAALRSGVGLVTAFAPSSVSASLAAQAPEAMWVPWPETDSGMLDAGAVHLLLERVSRANALLVGPGMGKGGDSEQLARKIIEQVELPMVLDADVLSHEVIRSIPQKRDSSAGPVILTPHTGEFARMTGLETKDVSNDILRRFCNDFKVTTVLKGPLTRICDGGTIHYNVHGGPVLSRGGSGDLLAGLIGGMVAQPLVCKNLATKCAVALHGLAAERLAQEKGHICVHTTQLLDYLSDVLRSGN